MFMSFRIDWFSPSLSFVLAGPTENRVRLFNQIVGKFAEKLSKILVKHKPWTKGQGTAVLRRCAFFVNGPFTMTPK